MASILAAELMRLHRGIDWRRSKRQLLGTQVVVLISSGGQLLTQAVMRVVTSRLSGQRQFETFRLNYRNILVGCMRKPGAVSALHPNPKRSRLLTSLVFRRRDHPKFLALHRRSDSRQCAALTARRSASVRCRPFSSLPGSLILRKAALEGTCRSPCGVKGGKCAIGGYAPGAAGIRPAALDSDCTIWVSLSQRRARFFRNHRGTP